MIGRAKLDVHYAPGEHDILDPKTRDVYLERFGKGATGGSWYSFDQGGVHFVSLNNVVDLKKNGLGSHPTLDDRARMGLGHRGFGAGAWASLALRLGDRAQRPHHQLMQKIEGNVTFHTARSTAFPQPAPRTAPAPGPKLVPAGELRKWLDVRQVVYAPTPTNLAVTDSDLA
jgi:3',5'-cyclic-AMP phosphodiesterase